VVVVDDDDGGGGGGAVVVDGGGGGGGGTGAAGGASAFQVGTRRISLILPSWQDGGARVCLPDVYLAPSQSALIVAPGGNVCVGTVPAAAAAAVAVIAGSSTRQSSSSRAVAAICSSSGSSSGKQQRQQRSSMASVPTNRPYLTSTQSRRDRSLSVNMGRKTSTRSIAIKNGMVQLIPKARLMVDGTDATTIIRLLNKTHTTKDDNLNLGIEISQKDV
jgi:hypothetical protein